MVQTCISTEKAPWDILSNYLTTGLFFFFFWQNTYAYRKMKENKPSFNSVMLGNGITNDYMLYFFFFTMSMLYMLKFFKTLFP